jgi:large subunit ribosomal protein L22
MEVVATARWVHTTARKARLVAETVEGLPVADALTILSFTPRAAAIEVAKVVKSAAANAEHNYNLDVSTLRVARIEIDGATVIKRFRPRAQGRAFSILKRTSHLRAVVSDDGALMERQRRRRSPAAASASPPASPAERRAAGAARVAQQTAGEEASPRGGRRPEAPGEGSARRRRRAAPTEAPAAAESETEE